MTTSKAMQMQERRLLVKRVKEAEERAREADDRAREVGKTIWEAILQAAQGALQEDERLRTVHKAMMKFQEGQRLTAREHEVLYREMQNRDLLKYAAATHGRFRPRQQRLSNRRQPRLLNGPKP
jgi:hypothetical protein